VVEWFSVAANPMDLSDNVTKALTVVIKHTLANRVMRLLNSGAAKVMNDFED